MTRNKLLQNSLYNVIYKLLNLVFPFITSIYVARVLLVDSIGKVGAAQNFVSYFTLLAGMGIPTYGVKLIAQFSARRNQLSKAFSELFVINFVLSAVSSIIFYALVWQAPFFDGKEILYSVCGMVILFNIFNVDWFYQGIQEYGYIAVRSLVFKLLSLIALICMVHKPEDYILYALISSAALVGNYIFNMFRIRKYTGFTLKGLHYSEHIYHISALFLAGIAAEVYVLADTTMLDILCGSTIVGYYTISMRIIRVIRGLVIAVSAVFLPQMSYYYFNQETKKFRQLSNKGIHILTILAVPAALGVFMVAGDAVTLFYGNGYSESIITTRILSISILTVAFSNFIGLQFFVTLGKGKLTTISTFFGAVANIILNLCLIRRYQHIGAAIASVITEGFVALLQLLMARKYIRFEFGFKKVLLASTCMVICVLLLGHLKIPTAGKLLFECGIGALIYVTVLFALKDELMRSICEMLQNKVKHACTFNKRT